MRRDGVSKLVARALVGLGAMVALAVALLFTIRSFSQKLMKEQVDNYASVVRGIALNVENVTSQSEQALLLFASSADFDTALGKYTDEGLSWPLNRISLQFCVYYAQVIDNMLISPSDNLEDNIWSLRRKEYVPLALVSSDEYAVFRVYRTARKNETSLGITVTNPHGYRVTAMISLDLLYDKVLQMVKLADSDDLLMKTSDGLIVMSRNPALVGLSAHDAYEELGRQHDVDVSPMLEIVEREQSTDKKAGRDTYVGYWFDDQDSRPTRKQVVFAKSVAGSGNFIISMVVDYQQFITYIGSSLFGITILALAICTIALGLWFHQVMAGRKRVMMEKENTYLRELNRSLTYVNEMARQKNQQQRLEIIGMLTCGIAHEFNNLLTPIMGYSGMLLEQKKPEDPEYDEVKEIFTASEKARDVIHQISSFGRKNSEPFKPVELKRLVVQITKLAKGLMPPSIRFSSTMPEREATVFCNTTQISQVVLNIILNAIDAIGKKEGHIRMTVDFVPAEQLPERTDSLADEFIAIRISDDGCGMDEATKGKIFEPFFTTKEKKGGNGLGLMVSDHIVVAHHGLILVDSEPGKGSTFSVLLPRSEERKVEERTEIAGITEMPSVDVLVVDPDPSTVDLYRKGLSKRQFHVTISQSGKDAMGQLRHHSYEVLVVDASVSDISWTVLTMKARQLWPMQTIVLVSSGMEKEVLDSLSSGILDGYIFKPFTVEELAMEVADVRKY